MAEAAAAVLARPSALTPEGRNAFARFVDHSEVPVEIGRFLRENP